jgi:hypothetical protein
MKKIISLLIGLFLITNSALAATSSSAQGSTFNSGGGGNSSGTGVAGGAFNYPVGSVSEVITLIAGSSGAAANNFVAFYLAGSNGGTQYQVTSGKTFYVLSETCYNQLAVAANQLGYGTAALAADPTATAPTGAVYFGNPAQAFATPFYSPTASTFSYYQIPLKFPASSYPFIKVSTINNAMGCAITGFEK